MSESTIIDVEATNLHVNSFHYFNMLIREGHISPLNGNNCIFILFSKLIKEMQVMKIQEPKVHVNDVWSKRWVLFHVLVLGCNNVDDYVLHS